MTAPASEPPRSARLLDIFFGYMLSQAISTAAQLGIADLLKDGPRSAEEIASQAGLHPRSTYRLLRSLASAGIFSETPQGQFELTPLAEPLRSDVPDSVRPVTIFMGTDWHNNAWTHLPYSIRTGQPAFEHLYGKPFFDYLGEHEEPARVFNNGMTSLSASVGKAVVEDFDFSGIGTLMDVGGGHGLLLASILQKYPSMRGILFDAPSVIEGARQSPVIRPVEERLTLVDGNFFEAVPRGADACIMKHIIHDWDDDHAVTILRHCRAAMGEQGRILVVEIVLPEGNAPSFGKFLDLEMLLFMRSFERTEEQYRSLFEKAGFRLSRVVPTGSPYSVIEGVAGPG